MWGEGDAAFAITERGGASARDDDGAVSGPVTGTYLHGLFADDGLRGAVLRALAARRGRVPDPHWGAPRHPSERYDRLADIVAGAVDMAAIARLVGLRWPSA
jgi:cobyric acid synthase